MLISCISFLCCHLCYACNATNILPCRENSIYSLDITYRCPIHMILLRFFNNKKFTKLLIVMQFVFLPIGQLPVSFFLHKLFKSNKCYAYEMSLQQQQISLQKILLIKQSFLQTFYLHIPELNHWQTYV